MLSNSFTKDNLDVYLKELAKEYRKENGKFVSAEIILVGGAAILANYGFREMTTDIDAVIRANSSIRDAANYVRDKYNLPIGWINMDFVRTGSYSPKLDEFSVHYKSFYGVLNVRSIRAEYLIAMKLRSGRKYKNDLSDVIGILAEHEKTGENITMEQIETAVMNLYGGWRDFPTDSKDFIENALENGEFIDVYRNVKKEENISRDILVDFEMEYPRVTNESNVNFILETLKSKQKQS